MTLVHETVVIIGGMSSSSEYSRAVYTLDTGADDMLCTQISNTSGPQPLGKLSVLCPCDEITALQ